MKILTRSVIIFMLLAFCYSGYVKWNEYQRSQVIINVGELNSKRMILVQCEAAWIGLGQLDGEDMDLIRKKTYIMSSLMRCISDGQERFSTEDKLGEMFERQDRMRKDLLQKETLEQGLTYLQSEEVSQMLADLTNLVAHYQNQEDLLREKLSRNP